MTIFAGEGGSARTPPTYPNVPWPLAKSIDVGNGTVAISPAIQLVCDTGSECDPAACGSATIVGRAFARIKTRQLAPRFALAPNPTEEGVLTQLTVCVLQHEEDHAEQLFPGPSTNESYTVHVPLVGVGERDTIGVRAETVFGVLWAFESLGHLASFQHPGRVTNAPVAIEDEPQYPVRGLMINPAGRFMDVPFLMRAVDGLAANKMNYLHIHFTDVTSFPIVSLKYPRLAEYGRMARMVKDAAPKNATTYTHAALRALVAYAADRGVRVVPEFDMPGHGAWHYGMPELCLTSCPHVLDVTKEEVYAFLTEFLLEMADLFPDPVMMLGGDEVGLSCVNASGDPMFNQAFDLDPSAAAWLKAHNMTSSEATDYFWHRVTSEIGPKLNNKTLQIWYCPDCHTGDPPLLNMPKSTIADVWGSIEYAAEACNHGYRSMLSMSAAGKTGSGWYLPPFGDCKWPGSWLRDIDAELDALGCTAEKREKFILGGSAAAWTSDSTIFDYTTWEGAMGVAERLWAGTNGLPPQPSAPPTPSLSASPASAPAAPAPAVSMPSAPPAPPAPPPSPPLPPNLLGVEGRLAVHACHMKMRGFTISPYSPNTGSMSGRGHWCAGGHGRGGVEKSFRDGECFPCPATWEWGQTITASYNVAP